MGRYVKSKSRARRDFVHGLHCECVNKVMPPQRGGYRL